MHHVNVMRDALGLPHVGWSESKTFAVQDWVATANTSCLSTASPMEPPPINFLLLDETTFANASFRYPIKEWYLVGNSHWNYTSNACVDGMYDVDCYRLRYLVGSLAMGCDVSCACPGEDPKLRRLWCSFDLPEGFTDNFTIPAPSNLKTVDLTLLEANDLGPAASGQGDDNSIRFPSDS
ncbi:hypothetical protein DYB35_006594 [Aphanomyces astaci]|nr:hypothetical protein DYB35_006594 [Aphanomyces astaci]